MLIWRKHIKYLYKKSFSTLIDGEVNTNSEQFMTGMEKYKEIMLKINIIRNKFSDGGGERSRIKHVHQNKKMLVDDRLRILFDKGKYLELGFFVGYGQSYGDIAKAGCVTALGMINKRLCAVAASDATVKGGTVYPIQLRKQLRIQNCSLKYGLPFIFIVDSGGAYLPLQADIFPDRDHGGRTFFNQAIMQSRGVTAISLVCGSCTAGAAYIPTMCSEMGMVSKTSHIFLGGPPLVKAATGEIIDSEELGGALMHGSISGCSDHTFPSESEGLMGIRDMVSTLPSHTMTTTNVANPVDPLFPQNDLNGLLINTGLNYDQRRTVIMQILARILDESSIHEFKVQFGAGLITGFGRISGLMIGILASIDGLSEHDCLKGSHFVQICGFRNIPIISLVHTEEANDDQTINEESKESYGLLIKAKALFMRSVATRNTKLITIIIGNAFGMDFICLGGQSMEPDFSFAWPNSRFGFTKNDIDDIENSSVLTAAGNMVIDDIINPNQTRQVITNCINILRTQPNLPIRINPHPILRF